MPDLEKGNDVDNLVDLEHLVLLAKKMGGHVQCAYQAQKWLVLAVTDETYDSGGSVLASGHEATIATAVIVCLSKLREKEIT